MSQETEFVTPGFTISNLLGLEKRDVAKAEIGNKEILLEKTEAILHNGKPPFEAFFTSVFY